MTTCKSPRKVLRLAYELGKEHLPAFASEFSRKDFTEPQLFACLVLREHQKKSYRGMEALLADSPTWLADIGMAHAPDHNTLCRAFKRIVKPALVEAFLDRMAQLGLTKKLLRRDRLKPLTLDSTMFESRHLSRHYERRQKETREKKSLTNQPKA